MGLPALAAVIVLVAEVQMWVTARAPRMVVTHDPATARRCDDLVRAGVIARIQNLPLLSIGYAAFAEVYLVLGPPHARSAALQIALQACLICGTVCAFLAIGLSGLEERLGGTITGWWGRPMPE